MNQLVFGKRGHLRFLSENEFYEALGFLAKSDGTTSLVWEDNDLSGAWGREGRILCYRNLPTFPRALAAAFRSGTGTILQRINCNAYLEHISQFHGFVIGRTQNITAIRNTVQPPYLADFNRGLTL